MNELTGVEMAELQQKYKLLIEKLAASDIPQTIRIPVKTLEYLFDQIRDKNESEKS